MLTFSWGRQFFASRLHALLAPPRGRLGRTHRSRHPSALPLDRKAQIGMAEEEGYGPNRLIETLATEKYC